MSAKRFPRLALAAAALVWACGGEAAPDADEARDLTLAPAESVATLNDLPPDTTVLNAGDAELTPQTPPPAAAPAPRPRPVQPRPERRPEPQPEPEPTPEPAPASLNLGTGTLMTLYAADSLSSKTADVGSAVRATIAEAVLDDDGEVVIPAGAVFSGTIQSIKGDSSEVTGGMVLAFDQVSFGGQSYAINGVSQSVDTRSEKGGVNAGDAAKVGAGAVVGGIIGRVVGGNKTGTAVGAAAGAAAGVGVAVATKGSDIYLDAGSAILVALSAPFELVR